MFAMTKYINIAMYINMINAQRVVMTEVLLLCIKIYTNLPHSLTKNKNVEYVFRIYLLYQFIINLLI